MHKPNDTLNLRFTPWRMFRTLLPQIASVAPKLFTGYVLLFILDAALFPLSIWAMQKLFDRIAELTSNIQGSAIVAGAVSALLLLFALKAAAQIVNGIAYFIAETYDPRSSARLTWLANRKMSRLHPIAFEDPAMLNDIEKAYVGIRFAIRYVNTMLDVLIVYVPQFVCIGIYLFLLRPSLSLAILLVFVPVLLSQLLRARVYASLEDTSAPMRRRADSYAESMLGRTALKQTRLLGGVPYFYRLYRESLDLLITFKRKADARANLLELGVQLLSLIGYFGVMALLVVSLMQGSIGIGAFAAVFASVDRMFALMEELIAGRLAQDTENFGKIRNYLRFMQLPERDDKLHEKTSPIESIDDRPPAIVCDHVSFTYPGSEKKGLVEISFSMRPAETLAVVGANGSGKTTLVRLLTGLYLPSEGAVLHNGVSTCELPPDKLFAGTSAVFQQFRRYRMTLEENVIISEDARTIRKNKIADPRCDSFEQNREYHLMNVLRTAGLEAHNELFPHGSDTMLAREYGGIDLSGGQWQRVAIARGLYRSHGFIVLDEPTAAIDPVEETRLYRQFAEAAIGRTAVIVTHRLGSVRLADRILVLDNGKIAGIGTHEELLGACPIYQKMWEAQARYYTERQKSVKTVTDEVI